MILKYIAILRTVICILLNFTGICSALYAQGNEYDSRNLEMLTKEREQNAREISNLSKLLESVDVKQQDGRFKLAVIQKKIDSRKSELNLIDKQADILHRQLKEKKATANELTVELDRAKTSYKELIVKYYNMQPPKNAWIMYVMASESMAQAYRRMRYIKEILSLLQLYLERIDEITGQLNSEINSISKKQTSLSSNLSDKQKEMEMLRIDEKNSQTVYSELKRQEAELKKRLSEREKAYSTLNGKIHEFMRSEMKNSSDSRLTEKLLASARDFEDMKGFLPQPAAGVIVASFGDNKVKSSYETVKLRSNKGIDILTAANSDVYSVFKGAVRRIIAIQGMQNVLIQHGSYYSVYSSMESVSVKEGDEVVARQKIGTVKNSKDGYILHFELWKNTELLNPENWILQ